MHAQMLDTRLFSLPACTALIKGPGYEVKGWFTIISSPFRHNRKPLIFQWALTLRNAGVGSGSTPAFSSVNAH